MGKKVQRLLVVLNLLFVIFTPLLPAQEPSQAINEYIIEEWNITREFPYDSVTSFAQTPDGYLWIGTRKGLVRCNGLKFEKIENVTGNKDYPELISCLQTDRNGDLLVGSIDGLTRVRPGAKNPFKTYSARDGFPANRITCIAADASGNTWIGTRDNDLYRLKEGKFEKFPLPGPASGRSISSIYPGKDGLYVAAFRDGLFKYDGEKFTRRDLPGKLTEDYSVYAVYRDQKGTGWIGTNKGLVKITGQRHDLLTTKDGLAGDHVSVIRGDEAGNLWVGTGTGLNRVISEGTGSLKIETILKNQLITSIFEDAEKSIWVGTMGSGMFRLRERIFRMLLTDESTIYFNLPIYEDKAGDILAGIDFDHFYKYSHGVFTPIVLQERIKNTYIYSLAKDCRGDILVGTSSKGVFHLREGKLTNYSTGNGLLSNCITAMYCDSRETLWICTYKGGVTCLENGILKTYTTKDGLLSDKVYAIYEDKDFNIWLGTRNGIMVLEGGRFNPAAMKKYLPETLVTSIYEDDDRVLWIGTVGKGLMRYEQGAFTTYRLEDGLKSKYIGYFLEDDQNNLWITSTDGILHVSKQELNEFARGNINKINCRIYGEEDGIKSTECLYAYENTAIKTRDDELWFTTRKGIVVVSPGKLYKNSVPPPVVIEKITVDKVSYDPSAFKKISPLKDIKSIEFHYTALTYILPGKAVFKTQLVGYEPGWILHEPGRERVVQFSNLPRGEYTFRVLACNRNGVWNNSGAAVTFVIDTGFLKSPVFRVMVVLLLILGIVGTVMAFKKFFFKGQRLSLKFVKPDKYTRTKLNPSKSEEYRQQLVNLLEEEKVFQDETISLQSLAKKLGIPAYQLSQIINENFNKNFFDLINSYRIEEAKKRLLESGENESTILDIAFEVGFNSKSTFNRAFKKYTGLSPTEFKNKYHGAKKI